MKTGQNRDLLSGQPLGTRVEGRSMEFHAPGRTTMSCWRRFIRYVDVVENFCSRKMRVIISFSKKCSTNEPILVSFRSYDLTISVKHF